MINKEQIKTDTEKLWGQIEKMLEFYDNNSCQCAFPRFRQFVSIDCTDTSDSYFVSETEAFISHCQKYFNIQKLPTERGGECASEIYTCKKCCSTFEFGWSDFSIYVNRSYLKLKEKKVKDIGCKPLTPIPVFIGPFGHSIPDNTFTKTEFDKLTDYLQEIEYGQ